MFWINGFKCHNIYMVGDVDKKYDDFYGNDDDHLYDDDETKSISDKNKIKRFYCPAHGDKSMNQNYTS